MDHHSSTRALTTLGAALIVVSLTGLLAVQPAGAQCGSQASSCKNCHETQGEDPVNTDGSSWHESHAFGDFCYICHGGNNQATDAAAAHAGMADPMSDVQAACAQCHPNDLQARADLYASSLGVVASLGSAPAAPSTPTPEAATAAQSPDGDVSSSPSGKPGAGQPELVDYVQRYDQQVLGNKPTNWGNVILLVMIGALLVGGGGLVISREGLVRVSVKPMARLGDEFPIDVVEMMPGIARLKPGARAALRRLLETPDAVADVLTSLQKLADAKIDATGTPTGPRAAESEKEQR